MSDNNKKNEIDELKNDLKELYSLFKSMKELFNLIKEENLSLKNKIKKTYDIIPKFKKLQNEFLSLKTEKENLFRDYQINKIPIERNEEIKIMKKNLLSLKR